MALLDTDVLIDLLRGHTPTWDWLNMLADAPDVPGFATMELYQGCRNKREQVAKRKKGRMPLYLI